MPGGRGYQNNWPNYILLITNRVGASLALLVFFTLPRLEDEDKHRGESWWDRTRGASREDRSPSRDFSHQAGTLPRGANVGMVEPRGTGVTVRNSGITGESTGI